MKYTMLSFFSSEHHDCHTHSLNKGKVSSGECERHKDRRTASPSLCGTSEAAETTSENLKRLRVALTTRDIDVTSCY
jgi:hypothetical protein